MNDQQLRRCRAVHKNLTTRLRVLKVRLRTIVVDQDVLGLAGTNIHSLMRSDADRLAASVRLMACTPFVAAA